MGNISSTFVLAKTSILIRQPFVGGGQKDRDLAEQFMGSLIKNVSALLEKSELLIEEVVTRDQILKADKKLNHYRWKAEKLIPSMQSTNKALVEVAGAVGRVIVSWAEDAVSESQKVAQKDLKQLPKRGENEGHETARVARKS